MRPKGPIPHSGPVPHSHCQKPQYILHGQWPPSTSAASHPGVGWGGGTRQCPGHALLPRTRMGLLSLPARGLSLLQDPLLRPLPSFQPRVNVQSSPGALITQAALIGLLHLAHRAQLESEGCPRLPPPPVPAPPTSQLSSLTGHQGCPCLHQIHFLQPSLGTSWAPSIGIAWELNQITLQGSQIRAPIARVKAKGDQS